MRCQLCGEDFDDLDPVQARRHRHVIGVSDGRNEALRRLYVRAYDGGLVFFDQDTGRRVMDLMMSPKTAETVILSLIERRSSIVLSASEAAVSGLPRLDSELGDELKPEDGNRRLVARIGLRQLQLFGLPSRKWLMAAEADERLLRDVLDYRGFPLLATLRRRR